jgi:uncharacterized protein YdeI (YjbR/CyaY-like superfamily)
MGRQPAAQAGRRAHDAAAFTPQASQRVVSGKQGAGRSASAGGSYVEAAKKDGSWDFLDDVERLEVPADLAEALAAYPEAAQHFSAFPRSVRRAILEWIKQAKQPETRVKRVLETAALASENKRANQYRS